MNRLVGLAVCAALAAGSLVNVPRAAAQDQAAAWHFVDDPQLRGPQGTWEHADSNGWWADYHYTHGGRDERSATNWAVWNMGSRAGTQPVWVYIPKSDRVRATVNYRVHANGDLLASKMFDQNLLEGWQQIGSWAFNGAVVDIRVYDNETLESYDPSNPADSRMGIDAAAMKCTDDCGNYSASPQAAAWHFVDDPQLRGPQGTWEHADSNGWWADYHYTHGGRDERSATNWAVWNMGSRAGTQPVWVYIPKSDRVRATVNYRVHANGDLLASKMFDQNLLEGWQQIGSWAFNGAVVDIRVYDNETLESYDPSNPADSRMGIDAAAMKCTDDCGNYSAKPAASTIDPYEYPYLSDLCGGSDEWRFIKRNCTSFVAWRLNDAGIPFHLTQTFDTGKELLRVCTDSSCDKKWGNANDWDEQARHLGINVNGTPAAGSVLQLDTGDYGHVAYVEYVDSNGIPVISEMNGPLVDGESRSCKINAYSYLLPWHARANPEYIHFEELTT